MLTGNSAMGKFFGHFYRTQNPSSKSEENNSNINNLLHHVSGKKYSHKCFVADFNFRKINWLIWVHQTSKNANKHNLSRLSPIAILDSSY